MRATTCPERLTRHTPKSCGRRWQDRGRGFALMAIVAVAGCAAQPEEKPAPEERYQQANVLSPDEATVVAYPEAEVDDPLMTVNRAIFAFNDVSYRYVLIPMAEGYQALLPDPVRSGVSNVFANIKTPISIVNHLLQGEAGKAGDSSLRFLVNTTLGVAGIFDAAEHWFGISEQTTGFGETLADYGSADGVYLVLPLLGSADVRSGAGLVVDYFLNPIPYLTDQPETTYIMSTDGFQQFSDRAEHYETLREKSADPYLFFRNMYLQGQMRDRQFPAPDAEPVSAGGNEADR